MKTILKVLVMIFYFGSIGTIFICFNMAVWFDGYKAFNTNMILSSCAVLLLCLGLKKIIDAIYGREESAVATSQEPCGGPCRAAKKFTNSNYCPMCGRVIDR